MKYNIEQIERRSKAIEKAKLFDKICQNSVPFFLEVKKRLAARPKDVVDELISALDERLHALGIPDDQKARVLSDVFMKAAGPSILEDGFLTEEELTAPPKITWRNRDKSRGLTIIEHIEEQFADRIGRGFRRSDLRTADPSSEKALRNWLLNPAHGLPDQWLEANNPHAEIAELFRDAMTLRNRREKMRLKKSKSKYHFRT